MVNYPNSLLKLLNQEEKNLFYILLNKKKSEDLELVKELNKLFASFGGFFSSEKSYKEILIKVCQKKDLKIENNYSVNQIEELILQNKFKTIIENLGEENKQKFQDELNILATKNGIDTSQLKSISAIGTLAGANFAGFGLYVMASTFMGGITSVIGVTLPFAFYTGMSSVLSVVTGPIGWIAGFGYLAYSFRNDNMESAHKKLIDTYKGVKNVFTGNIEHCEIIISQICSFRIILLQKLEKELIENNSQFIVISENISNYTKLKNETQQKITELNRSLIKIKDTLAEFERKYHQINILNSEINQKIKTLKL
jgi:uncharacterized protein YaaW (UPF0174 family)